MSQCSELHPPSSCAGAFWDEDTFVGFRPEPNCGRGTVGIVWTCLTVMFFSAWSVIHVDTRPTPSPFSFQSLPRRAVRSMQRRFTGDEKQGQTDARHVATWHPTFRKFLQAVIMLVFPEYAVLNAVDSRERFVHIANATAYDLTEEFTVARLIQHRTREIDRWESFTLKQAHLVRMGGIIIPQLDQPEYFSHFVAQNAHVLDYDRFPDNARITLRAKRDFADKLIALTQSLYFLSNLSVRNARGYRISGIELHTLNYIAYASIVFLLRLHKPQDLGEPFELDLVDLPSPSVPLDTTKDIRRPRLELWIWLGTFVSVGLSALVPVLVLRKRDAIWYTGNNKNDEAKVTSIALIGAFAMLMFMLRRQLENGSWTRDTFIKSIVWYISIIAMYLGFLVYAGWRVFLLVIVSLQLNHVPEGVYLVPNSWTRYIGHVGA
ncbi:hypothetical protein FB567DRAFT_548790 [Paraphoma chrysanthemicola]|uniref:Uncharacterized protein n=1 Tax=Paraphoma chrysanthemicola TaxID=798071 RepID=A0A8K0R5G9_9PLEO|nr:hypothetical protein FB567DRAFT_548790 [Paraphoma chrysanthemicola]